MLVLKVFLDNRGLFSWEYAFHWQSRMIVWSKRRILTKDKVPQAAKSIHVSLSLWTLLHFCWTCFLLWANQLPFSCPRTCHFLLEIHEGNLNLKSYMHHYAHRVSSTFGTMWSLKIRLGPKECALLSSAHLHSYCFQVIFQRWGSIGLMPVSWLNLFYTPSNIRVNSKNDRVWFSMYVWSSFQQLRLWSRA